MTRRGAISWLAGAGGLALAGCGNLFGTSVRLRYRITITCETPDGIKSGSAVQEMMRHDPIEAIKPVNIGTTEMTGDAVVITIGDNHYFVGLVKCGALLIDAIQIGKVQPPSAKIAGNSAAVLKVFKEANGRAELEGGKYMSLPSRGFGLINFADEKDFTTIQSMQFSDDLAGWALRSVVVSFTTDPITRQTIAILPWLQTLSREDVKNNPKNDGYLNLNLESLSDKFGAGS